jgi:murein DD-endopeptidase MepM/ murein hydrolase activator NlpD
LAYADKRRKRRFLKTLMKKASGNSRMTFLWLALFVALIALTGFYLANRRLLRGAGRSLQVLDWLRDSADHPEWAIQAKTRCAGAPFIFPTSGMAGYLWDDSFRVGHRHQGIDIFGGGEVNTTPVYAAYAGFLTRLPDWKSSVIIRIPNDPLSPGRQIWTYYTHMADPQGNSFIDAAFPPGIVEQPVEAGTLLGYQGNFSGTPGNPVGVHLHFSIVKDDGQGHFTNELEFRNTFDPSPYLGLPLNAGTNPDKVPTCADEAAGKKGSDDRF